MLLEFPGKRLRHGRASAGSAISAGVRAARSVINFADTPAAAAWGVARMADHHSAGIDSRCHHLDTAEALAPMSDAKASIEGQRLMIERNEVGAVIANPLGQFVLNGKAMLSYDCEFAGGHNVLMVKKPSRAERRAQFAQRVKRAREDAELTQTQVAAGLGIKQDRYKHYEIARYLPHDMIEAFCMICDVGPEFFYPQGDYSYCKPRPTGSGSAVEPYGC